MISNQILQSNIEGLKEITRIDLCVCDVEGNVLHGVDAVLISAEGLADMLQLNHGKSFFPEFLIRFPPAAFRKRTRSGKRRRFPLLGTVSDVPYFPERFFAEAR